MSDLRPLVRALALAALGLAACGNTTAAKTDPVVPATPFQVQFRFTNSGAAPVDVYEGCVLDLKILTADGAHDVSPAYACGCTCGEPSCNGPVACGACAEQAREIVPGDHLDYQWTAATYTTESRGTWQCVRTSNLPPGDYRVQIPVYATADDATAKTGARLVGADFALPAAQTPVAVELTAP